MKLFFYDTLNKYVRSKVHLKQNKRNQTYTKLIIESRLQVF